MQSSLAEANHFPSGLKARLLTAWVWPCKTNTNTALDFHWTFTKLNFILKYIINPGKSCLQSIFSYLGCQNVSLLNSHLHTVYRNPSTSTHSALTLYLNTYPFLRTSQIWWRGNRFRCSIKKKDRSNLLWIKDTRITHTYIYSTLMFVSMELEARKSPNGWKPRLVMLALCPIRVLKTEENKSSRSHDTQKTGINANKKH